MNVNRSAENHAEHSRQGRPKGRALPLLRGVLCLAIILTIVLITDFMARENLSPVRLAGYLNRDLAALEDEGKSVELMIFGASQVYHACDTRVLSDVTGFEEVVDIASAGAPNSAQYYLVEDMLKRFHPDVVILDRHFNSLRSRESDGDFDTGTLLASDLLSRKGKLSLMTDTAAFPVSLWPNVSALYRYGGEAWQKTGLTQLVETIAENRDSHRRFRDGETTGVLQEGDITDRITYVENGFEFFKVGRVVGSIPADSDLEFSEEELVDEAQLSYLDRTIELSREYGATVILMSLPDSDERLLSYTDYMAVHDFYEEYAASQDFTYLDFNLLKDRAGLFADNQFYDEKHLNGPGAADFSKVLGNMLVKLLDGEDVSDAFYEEVSEYADSVKRVCACNAMASENEDGSVTLTVWTRQGSSVTPKVRILATADGISYAELTGWTDPGDITISDAEIEELISEAEEKGTRAELSEKIRIRFRIEAAQEGSDTVEAFKNKVDVNHRTVRSEQDAM